MADILKQVDLKKKKLIYEYRTKFKINQLSCSRDTNY